LKEYNPTNLIYYDCFSQYCTDNFNPINTHLLICESGNESVINSKLARQICFIPIIKCTLPLKSEIKYKDSLHEFKYYSELYNKYVTNKQQTYKIAILNKIFTFYV
jgi:hypothetical protein